MSGLRGRCPSCDSPCAETAALCRNCRHRAQRASAVVVLAERFWSKVDKSGECWIWTAARTSNGYGVFRIAGRNVVAHRMAWALGVGPCPTDLEIDHLCRNQSCVRPDHLEPVTATENRHRQGAARTPKAICVRGHLRAGNLTAKRECLTCRATRQRVAA